MSQLTVDSDRFNAATDERLMLGLFAKYLPEKFGGRISIDGLWIPRVTPLKSGEYAIQFRLRISGDAQHENLTLWGKLIGAESPESEAVYANNSRVLKIEEIGLVIPIFPYDPKLPVLERLWGSGQNQPVRISTESENAEELWFTPCQVLGYRLEKRCTLLGELRSGSGGTRNVALKLMRPRAASALSKAHRFLARSGLTTDAEDGITTPEIVFTDEQAGIIISEAVAHPSLHDLKDPERFIAACASAGRALSRLHSLAPAELPEFTLTDELSMLRRKSKLAAKIYPDVAESFAIAIDALELNQTGMDHSGYVVSHRDFFDKQILISDERVTLLDFDTLAMADPALDVGNFLAHLFLRGLQNSELRESVARRSDAFTTAYTSSGNDLPQGVRWWQAATLVRLAGLYNLRPRWRQIAPELLNQAVREMDNVVH